jgi:excisionase family DNA binding protein
MTTTTAMRHYVTDSDEPERTDDMTVQQVAKMLNTTPATIRRWVKAGAFPKAWKPVDTQQTNWRIPKSSVIAWMNRREQQSGQ